ncbi:hypothetical protein ES332_D03G165500v1 [Gossypium tomentosum]|uniref:Late embryogenesis abundant protein LEA-2 subgroup domain-containing protein n=1 Tax=Gossypium tomentosum TaxID=34277 RepID=A0A5D2LPS6_GOSTO|nr:hypothetical protein ES332_D03G165500v1 [Gossypium tomentosum]
MAERIYPGDSPPSSGEHSNPKPAPPSSDKPIPQPGTYVVQIPKDQVYRVPPPENARRYAHLSKPPNYSVESVAIKGFNLTSPSPLSPEFDVTVRADNGNDKIGIYYEKGSSVNVYYQDVNLSNGALPVFYQPTNNVTLFKTALKGSGIELTAASLRSISNDQNKGTVPFTLKLRAPVKIKAGSVKTWKITVKVTCKITVDKLTAASKIVSKDCDYGVDLWRT